eukprot:scaffold1120_cov57-Phaeocystis_antarctica.AAC.4
MPSAAARKTQGARAHPPIPLDRPGGTPSVHSGRFPPPTGGCFLGSAANILFGDNKLQHSTAPSPCEK